MKYSEEHEESADSGYKSGEIKDLSERIDSIQHNFRLVLVDSNKTAYDQFRKTLGAYAKIDKLLTQPDSARNRKEIDKQLLIAKVSLGKVDVFLQSQSERMKVLQEEEESARAEGRSSRKFITDLGKYKKVVEVEYEKPRGYFVSGGVESTQHMKIKFPDAWYKEKAQAAGKFLTLLDKGAIVLIGFNGLDNDDEWGKVCNAIEDMAEIKSPSHKAFLKIAAKYDDDTVYGPEGALNIILGMQRALRCLKDGDFDYLCSADSGKKKNQVEIHLIPTKVEERK